MGQQDELALGILASSVISLAAQSKSGAETRFTILDGTRPEAPEAALGSGSIRNYGWELRSFCRAMRPAQSMKWLKRSIAGWLHPIRLVRRWC